MEPATTSVWAEMLTDRKFAEPVVGCKQRRRRANSFRAAFGASPFRPVGPEGTVEMDTVRPFVGKHSPRVKLDGSEPHGIQQSRLRLGRGKSYEAGFILPAIPAPKLWSGWCGARRGRLQTVRFHRSRASTGNSRSSSPPAADTEEARLEILGTGSGTFHVGAVSLMPADNVQGFHAGMIRLFKRKVSRWSSGPAATLSRPTTGTTALAIGQAPAARSSPCGHRRIESNDVGLHEFIALCRLVGAEPDMAIDSGFGSAREAAEEVEYCNGSVKTRMGKMRAENGHPEPFNVRLWTIGNEMYGAWQYGHMSQTSTG